MTLSRYLLGLAILIGAVGPVVAGAHSLRSRLLADWNGPLAVLAEAVLAIAMLCCISHGLGAVGLFRALPLVLSCALIGGGAALLASRLGASCDDEGPPARSRPSGVELAVAGAGTALVTAIWSTWVSRAFSFGIENRDSLWYHLPIAARFVQEGRLTDLHFLNGEALVTYYPANASLLHSLGFLAFGRDDLSLLINFMALPLGLLAAWSIARRWDAGLVGLTGGATALALPVFAASQPGSAKDDLLSAVFLLAAVAFLANAGSGSRSLALSGAAAGMALGTKLTMVVPVAVLGLGVALMTRRSWRPAAAWLAGSLMTGSFWYLRNLITAGNPIPSFGWSAGPLELPSPPTPSIDRFGEAVINFIRRADAWDAVFAPGLRDAFGPAWPLLFLLAVAGIGLAIARGDAAERLAGLVGAGMGLAFLFLPGTAYGVGVLGYREVHSVARLIFAYNLRYLVPALALGLILLSLAARGVRGVGRWVVLGAYAFILLATQGSQSGLRAWAGGYSPVALTVVVVVGLIFWMMGRVTRETVPAPVPAPTEQRSYRFTGRLSPRLLAAALVAVTLVVAGWPLSRAYHDRRYQAQPLAAWSRGVRDKRIAIAGFAIQFPLFGADLSNHVQYLGRQGRDGAFLPFQECLEWRRALRAGRYDFVITPTHAPTPALGFDLARWQLGLPQGEPPRQPPESTWNQNDPGLRQVFERRGATVYEISPEVSSALCG